MTVSNQSAIPRAKVMVVDDHPVICGAVRNLCKFYPGLECVAEARGRDEALEQIATAQPDLIVLDLMMSGHTGFELIHDLLAQRPAVRVLVFTVTRRLATSTTTASTADSPSRALAPAMAAASASGAAHAGSPLAHAWAMERAAASAPFCSSRRSWSMAATSITRAPMVMRVTTERASRIMVIPRSSRRARRGRRTVSRRTA